MKFIHFGCWNNGTCNIESGDNGLSKTMRKLRDFISINPIDFLVVAGDNYYPSKSKNDKGEKVKTLNVADLKSGFACLPKAVKKYILFGNHEYDDVASIINEGVSTVSANEEKCKILTLEQEQSKIIDTPDNINLFQDVMFVNKDGTLLIMIDTTIYEDDIESTKDSCFKHIFPTLTKKDTIQDFMTHQETRIRDILAENKSAKNIIFVGHHPIISVKIKNDKPKPSSLEKFKQLFININGLLLGKKLYYLCADTHLYQHGKVTIKSSGVPDIEIDQYICGTGGAEQDECPPPTSPTSPSIIENKDKTLSFNMSNCSKIFGFLVVDIKDDVINFNFQNTEESGKGIAHGGSYYSKYMKYKLKYEKLKLQYQQY
jgi:hypothetical protein